MKKKLFRTAGAKNWHKVLWSWKIQAVAENLYRSEWEYDHQKKIRQTETMGQSFMVLLYFEPFFLKKTFNQISAHLNDVLFYQASPLERGTLKRTLTLIEFYEIYMRT